MTEILIAFLTVASVIWLAVFIVMLVYLIAKRQIKYRSISKVGLFLTLLSMSFLIALMFI